MYDTECLDDLYQAYYNGETDYNVLKLLTDSYDTGGLDSLDLEAIGVFERNELLSDSINSDINQFWLKLMSLAGGKAGYRRYSKNFEKIANYYFLHLPFQSGNLVGEVEDNNNGQYWSKRHCNLSTKMFDIILGNFAVSEGHGLTIGRLDYLPSAGLDEEVESDFLYPFNSFYNGIKLSSHLKQLNLRLYYSDKKYNLARKKFIGSGLDFTYKTLSLGLAIGYNRFEDEAINDNRLTAGLNFELKDSEYIITGEYATVEKSSGFYIKGIRNLTGKTFRIGFWRYGKDFNSYNCSGPSSSDYFSFYPGNQSLGFKSAQAGESGLALKYIMDYISYGVMFWNNINDEKINASINFTGNKPVRNNLDIFFLSSAKVKQHNEYLWFKAGCMSKANSIFKRAGIKLYFVDDVEMNNSKSYSFLNFRRYIKENFKVFLKIRNYFDGQTRLFIGEELMSDMGLNITAELTVYNGARVNLKIEKQL